VKHFGQGSSLNPVLAPSHIQLNCLLLTIGVFSALT
jgi:hypothetical protein